MQPVLQGISPLLRQAWGALVHYWWGPKVPRRPRRTRLSDDYRELLHDHSAWAEDALPDTPEQSDRMA